MNKPGRRKFIKQSVAIVPTIALLSACNQVNTKKAVFPIVISTWDSGLSVNNVAWDELSTGNKAIDAVEKGANSIENKINCCVGLGGNPDRDGYVTLDACIMDDNHNCGSVAFLHKIKNPISVARKIMDTTPHVMLVGDGALQFAIQNGLQVETGELSETAQKEYDKWLEKSEYKPQINIEQTQGNQQQTNPPTKLEDGSFNHDTMGLLALDSSQNLSGACTTSGMGFKMRGRVGDSPIIGAGLYVDNEVGAAASSGQGEEVIRICGTHLVVEFMRNGDHPQKACEKAIGRLVKINPEKAKTFQVGFIAINKNGEVGSFAIQPGFSYSLKTSETSNVVVPSESHFKNN